MLIGFDMVSCLKGFVENIFFYLAIVLHYKWVELSALRAGLISAGQFDFSDSFLNE